MRDQLPWARPRHELLLLALVACVALSPVYGMNAQDVSRLCLTSALVHGQLSNDACLQGNIDKASYGGHLYSDKAPGMSVLEIPSAEALRLPSIQNFRVPGARLWGVRVLSSGLAFLILCFLIGRVSEGLAPGYGGASIVAFGLGTLIEGLAASNFGHVTAAVLTFAAFLLAWRERPLLAGLAAGMAPLVEYPAAATTAILALYLLVRNRRQLASYVAGVVPGVVLLLIYDTLAFGSPWHLSYSYVANGYASEQTQGFFGVSAPHLFSSYEVFADAEGLLVVSPVLVAAVWGLILLFRRHREETLVCAAVATFFVLMNCGYFLPYGGVSPGPRFLVPALPFLAVGLGPAFAWRPRLTALLTLVSVVGNTGVMLVWSTIQSLRGSIWGELARMLVEGSSSRFGRNLAPNVLGWFGVGRTGSAAAVAVAAVAAVALSFRAIRFRATGVRRQATLAVALSLCLVCVATASAVGEYPFASSYASAQSLISTSIRASTALARPGADVRLTITVANPTAGPVGDNKLVVELPHGLTFVGRPRGRGVSGCGGTGRLMCNLDDLLPKTSTQVRLGIRVQSTGPRKSVVAWTISSGTPGRTGTFTFATGSG